MTDRESLLYNTKLAEQTERFDEMVEWITRLVKVVAATGSDQVSKQLTSEERNLLSVAFKNAVGARRASWRVICAIELKEKSDYNEHTEQLAVKYRIQVESEIRQLCMHILDLLTEQLIPFAASAEARVTFLKMLGDYHRYIAEIATGEERVMEGKAAAQAYADAANQAETALSVTSPARLALALNRSVFYFEILNVPDQACILARQAFEAATSAIESEGEEAFKESALILQLLRDNLTLWTTSASS